MLEAIEITKSFGTTVALNGVNLRVNPGEIYCLLGANGAGKTTLINLFLDFIAPTSGQLRVNGIDVTQNPLEVKRFTAYIPSR